MELHSAGATIRHQSIFKDLTTFENAEELTEEFRERWVIPFYFNLDRNDKDWVIKMISLKEEISDEVILMNLGDFDWRTRSTGAFFAAIKDKRELTEIIGNHLLKSEVCFAGRQYAITLASFNSEQSVGYLNEYLNYYLLQQDLEFDQIPVARAIKYLDEVNGTSHFQDHKTNLQSFQKHRTKQAEIDSKKFIESGAAGMAKTFEHRDFWKEELNSEPVRKSIETLNKIKQR